MCLYMFVFASVYVCVRVCASLFVSVVGVGACVNICMSV